MEHVPYGIRVRISTPPQGTQATPRTLSVQCDLRNMDAWAVVGHNDCRIPLRLNPFGLRWIVEIPPQSSAVIFTARESGALRFLTLVASITCPLLVTLIGSVDTYGMIRPCRFSQ